MLSSVPVKKYLLKRRVGFHEARGSSIFSGIDELNSNNVRVCGGQYYLFDMTVLIWHSTSDRQEKGRDRRAPSFKNCF